MGDSCSSGGSHDDYTDRVVTMNGVKYKVRRCKKCGREIYEKV